MVEQLLGGDFIPNDTELDGQDRQVLLLTGPNMGGKSTYLRQVALLALMAQAGGFVPAAAARLGVTDRIFTRVGASDNLARGESTFYMEMSETAHILHQMSRRSLVILDEIGRGTATYDGLSLAWAITEFLGSPAGPRPRSVFATHYHELTELEHDQQGLINLKLEVKEWEGRIIFMHAVSPGKSDKSYGIHVARLAGPARAGAAPGRADPGLPQRRGPARAARPAGPSRGGAGGLVRAPGPAQPLPGGRTGRPGSPQVPGSGLHQPPGRVHVAGQDPPPTGRLTPFPVQATLLLPNIPPGSGRLSGGPTLGAR